MELKGSIELAHFLLSTGRWGGTSGMTLAASCRPHADGYAIIKPPSLFLKEYVRRYVGTNSNICPRVGAFFLPYLFYLAPI